MSDLEMANEEEAVVLTFTQRATIVEELREVLAGVREGAIVYGDRHEQDAKIEELEEIIERINTPKAA